MFYNDIRCAFRFEINANLVQCLFEEFFCDEEEPYEPSSEIIREITHRCEDRIFRLIQNGTEFNLYKIIGEEISCTALAKPKHA